MVIHFHRVPLLRLRRPQDRVDVFHLASRRAAHQYWGRFSKSGSLAMPAAILLASSLVRHNGAPQPQSRNGDTWCGYPSRASTGRVQPERYSRRKTCLNSDAIWRRISPPPISSSTRRKLEPTYAAARAPIRGRTSTPVQCMGSASQSFHLIEQPIEGVCASGP